MYKAHPISSATKTSKRGTAKPRDCRVICSLRDIFRFSDNLKSKADKLVEGAFRNNGKRTGETWDGRKPHIMSAGRGRQC